MFPVQSGREEHTVALNLNERCSGYAAHSHRHGYETWQLSSAVPLANWLITIASVELMSLEHNIIPLRRAQSSAWQVYTLVHRGYPDTVTGDYREDTSSRRARAGKICPQQLAAISSTTTLLAACTIGFNSPSLIWAASTHAVALESSIRLIPPPDLLCVTKDYACIGCCT